MSSPRRIPQRRKLLRADELKLHDCVMLNAKHNETDWIWSAAAARSVTYLDHIEP